MTCCCLRRFTASALSFALVVATAPAFAAPVPATLTGTVYANDVVTPLAGATVIVTDASGVKTASQPTGANGVFTVAAVTPGRTELALETKEGSFAVATPVTLAPGETRGVQLALKAKGESKDGKRKSGGAGWTGGEIASMTVVLVGAAAAAWLNYDSSDSDEASPYTPPYTPPTEK